VLFRVFEQFLARNEIPFTPRRDHRIPGSSA
jgi:hypothetical protein